MYNLVTHQLVTPNSVHSIENHWFYALFWLLKSYKHASVKSRLIICYSISSPCLATSIIFQNYPCSIITLYRIPILFCRIHIFWIYLYIRCMYTYLTWFTLYSSSPSYAFSIFLVYIGYMSTAIYNKGARDFLVQSAYTCVFMYIHTMLRSKLNHIPAPKWLGFLTLFYHNQQFHFANKIKII